MADSDQFGKIVEDCPTSKAEYLSSNDIISTNLNSGSHTNELDGNFEAVEVSDSNGRHRMMKQRSSPGSNLTNVDENSESSQPAVSSSNLSFNTSGTGNSSDITSTTPTSASNVFLPLPHSDSKKYSKSPSTPALPIAHHNISASPFRSENSTPTLDSYQNGRQSPGSGFYVDAAPAFLFTPDEAGDQPAKVLKQESRKKKRSPSWYNVISPSSKQKNESFHKTFKNIPDTERLLVDYTCALMKDILVQGRMYASQNYLCFHSNILKWQTEIVVDFKDIRQITKEKTVKLFPNAIQFHIKTRDKAPVFTSFTQRDRAYLQLLKIWQNSNREKPLPVEELLRTLRNNSSNNLPSSDDEQFKSESPAKEKKNSNYLTAPPAHHNLHRDESIDKVLTDRSKTSSSCESSGDDELSDDQEELFPSGTNSTGSSEHPKIDLQRLYMNREFAVPAQMLFKTIFSPECGFWKDYLEGKGSFDVMIGCWEDGDGENEGDQVKMLSYNLALTNPLGPKSAKVEEKQILYKESVARCCYAVDCIARTLRVPYSNYFATVMRYSIRRLTDSSCEMRVTAQIDFCKTPWGLVKNFIEKNVHEGMEENFQLLEQELDTYFARHRHTLFYISQEESADSSRLRKRKKRSRRSKSVERSGAVGSEIRRHPHSLTNSNHIAAAPTTGPVVQPYNDVGRPRVYPSSQQVESKSNKLFYLLIIIIFLSLLWSNYRMYERLNVLEQLHSHLNINDNQLYKEMACDSSRDGSRDEVCDIIGRVESLEALIAKHVTSTDAWWHHITKEWRSLREEINKALQQSQHST